MISNKEVHDYYKCQKSDLYHQFCGTNVAKHSGINMGIKLYNKLPPVIKNLEMAQEFKSGVKDFLVQHMFYSVEEIYLFRRYVNFIIIIIILIEN